MSSVFTEKEETPGMHGLREKGRARMKQEGGLLQVMEQDLRRNPTCQHLDLGLPASRTERTHFCCFNFQSMAFVMAALAG